LEQNDLLEWTVALLERQGLQYMLVGSVASSYYGLIRSTQDIDFVVRFTSAQLEAFCAEFSPDDFYVSLPAAREALLRGGQFNIIHFRSGNKLDIMLPRQDAWGQQQLSRRRAANLVANVSGYVAAPEDIILGKLWYYREGEHEKHLRDIVSILQEQRELDRDYLQQWITQLGYNDLWEVIEQRLKLPPKEPPRG
jgi:hypothetical protein